MVHSYEAKDTKKYFFRVHGSSFQVSISFALLDPDGGRN
jgi:hypothetical protein